MTDSAAQLRATFEMMKSHTYAGVSGVLKIDSGVEGPVLGITACTHGNEPSGLAIIEHLLGDFDLKSKLLRGSVFLVINNIEAVEKFFAAKDADDKREARQVDMNMNRLPRDTLSKPNPEVYESIRANELEPIWREFTVGLDIHSTTDNDDPMIISRGGDFEAIRNLIPGFPINVLISNIDAIQIGIPVFSMYGEADTQVPVFAIEAGQHEEAETFRCASTCAVSLLQNLGMIEGTPEITTTEFKEYYVFDSIMFEDMSYDLVKKFKSFQRIRRGQLLAKNSAGDEIRAKEAGCLLIPTVRRGEKKEIKEEITFITRPMKIRRIS